MTRRQLWFGPALFFASGAAGMIFEVAWFRALGLSTFEVSTAVAVITAVFMAGLAWGARLGGALAVRLRHPLRVYALVELCIGVLGLAVPELAREVAAFAEASQGWDRLGLWVAAAGLLLLPTAAMGTTLPLLSAALSPEHHTVARRVGTLYGLNTAGALCGSLWTGGVGLASLGIDGCNRVAVVLQLGIGVCALVLSRGVSAVPLKVRVAPHPMTSARGSAWLWAGAASALAMLIQVAWTSRIAPSAGPASAFSGTVSIYLFGLSVGGLLAARTADRWPSVRHALGGVLLGTGGLVAFGLGVSSVWALSGWSTLFLLPATLGMGMVFPGVVRVVAERYPVGEAVGIASAASTLGAVTGSVGGALVVPVAGCEPALWGASGLYVVLAAALGWRRVARGVTPRSAPQSPKGGDGACDAGDHLPLIQAAALEHGEAVIAARHDLEGRSPAETL